MMNLHKNTLYLT